MTSFLKTLESLDHQLFYLINSQWTHPWLDLLFVFITDLNHNRWFLFFILPALLLLWLYKKRWQMVKVAVLLAIAVGLADMVSHRVIKAHVERPRPNHIHSIQSQVKVSGQPGGYSFTSNHAANSLAGAKILSFAYPSLTIPFYTYAFLVAYSRPYVGVHFPSDILFGGLLGFSIASILVFICRKLKIRPTRY